MSVGGGFDGDIGRGVTVGGAVSDIEWGGTLCGAVVGDLVCIWKLSTKSFLLK